MRSQYGQAMETTMPHQKITQALVDSLPFQENTVWYHDTDLPGFNLAVGNENGGAKVCHGSGRIGLLRAA